MNYKKALPVVAVTLSLGAGMAVDQPAEAAEGGSGLFSLNEVSAHGRLLAEHHDHDKDHHDKDDHDHDKDHHGDDHDHDHDKDHDDDKCGAGACGSDHH